MEREAELIAELQREHAVHTIILYGSRARGDATAESDIDIASFADVAETTRDARLWHGLFLDAFVYPTDVPIDAELLKLRGGRVLLDQRAHARSLLERLDAIYAAGPPRIADHERQMRQVWARKMLARIGRDDVEAHYRRHWLLFQILEDYFALRGEWFHGPKLALQALEAEEPTTFALLRGALAPAAPIDAIAALVDHIEQVTT
jgi:predicted nucleotidyltransferase